MKDRIVNFLKSKGEFALSVMLVVLAVSVALKIFFAFLFFKDAEIWRGLATVALISTDVLPAWYFNRRSGWPFRYRITTNEGDAS
ncbi:MAG: hypothetical protein AAB358_03635 [Patescibacteria group bacterium]